MDGGRRRRNKTGDGDRISKQFLCGIWKKLDKRPNVGGVSTRSRNGATSQKGCMVNGQMTKTSNKWLPPPLYTYTQPKFRRNIPLKVPPLLYLLRVLPPLPSFLALASLSPFHLLLIYILFSFLSCTPPPPSGGVSQIFHCAFPWFCYLACGTVFY